MHVLTFCTQTGVECSSRLSRLVQFVRLNSVSYNASNLFMSIDITLRLALSRGQFCDVIGQLHEYSVNRDQLHSTEIV